MDSFDGIGKLEYQFDCKDEEIIYANICKKRLSFKEKRRLKKLKEKENIPCNTYFEWEKYVYNKYKNYDMKALKNFKHYLKQGIRNNEMNRTYTGDITPVLLSVIITLLIDLMFKVIIRSGIITEFDLIINYRVCMFFLMLFLPMKFVALGVETSISDNISTKNMYLDYLDILDKMIEVKNKDKETIFAK